MTLFTASQYDKLIENGSLRSVSHDPAPVVKLHIKGADCVWLLTELNPDDPLIGFGLCDLGMGFPELGYVDLAEIASLKLPLGLSVEQDTDFNGQYPLSVYANAARAQGAITEDPFLLRRYHSHRKPGHYPC